MRQLSILFFYLILLSACSPVPKEAGNLPPEPSKSFASQINNEQHKQN
ncbi:hypothetical protein [Psychromonas hadalis]|nr:hypothetical protein [Psychromonas hadalis]